MRQVRTFRCLKGRLKNDKTTDSIAFSGFKFSRSGEITFGGLIGANFDNAKSAASHRFFSLRLAF